MAGIYLHIPFCKKACHYCNFHFSTSLSRKGEMVKALVTEISLMSDKSQNYLAGEAVETIYFGGGTPSLLTNDELAWILAELKKHFLISGSVEITLEANPDDISGTQLVNWRAAGINRLSIGTQSFFEEDLIWMNRAHNVPQAIDSIIAAGAAGFDNITIDLIYGTPFLTDARWLENLDRAIALGVPHLSCYALTVESATALDKMIRQHKSPDVDPEKQAVQFLLMTDRLQAAGYEHYEISNFAKPGMRSRHNSGYWQGKKYIGIGPSAHSFNGTSRQWNVANNALYIKSLSENKLPVEVEHLTTQQQFNEYVMTAIRTSEGIDLNTLETKFGSDPASKFKKKVDKFIRDKRVSVNGQAYTLTRDGKLFADGIAADLFS